MPPTFVTVRSFPPMAQVRADVIKLKKAIKNPIRPLQYSEQIYIAGVKEAFATETDPNSGRAWKPWAKSYQDWRDAKGYTGNKILRLEGKLYRAATSYQNYRVVKGGILLNTARLPFYWRVHQQGRKVLETEEYEAVNKIPRRRFLGTSKETEAKMVVVFDEWAKDTIRIYRRGRTLVKVNR